MTKTDYILEELKARLYPLRVERILINPYKRFGDIRVTASTGKYHASMVVTENFLNAMEIHDMAKHIKGKLNHDLEREIIKAYIEDTASRGFIVTTSMPEDKIYTMVHPVKYMTLLKEFGNTIFDYA